MYKSSRYSKKTNQDLEIRTLDVLNNSDRPLTVDDIQRKDFVLNKVTPQKMYRVLNKLIEMNFARKEHDTIQKKMCYRSVE